MDNCEHKPILLRTLSDFLLKLDTIPCPPKNKLLLYHRYIFSKLAWHLTIADLNETSIVEIVLLPGIFVTGLNCPSVAYFLADLAMI